MRPLRYSINITLDGCCDHRAILADEELHRHAVENLDQADALLFGRAIYGGVTGAGDPRIPQRIFERFLAGICRRFEARRVRGLNLFFPRFTGALTRPAWHQSALDDRLQKLVGLYL